MGQASSSSLSSISDGVAKDSPLDEDLINLPFAHDAFEPSLLDHNGTPSASAVRQWNGMME
jgi:hypothetical protein